MIEDCKDEIINDQRQDQLLLWKLKESLKGTCSFQGFPLIVVIGFVVAVAVMWQRSLSVMFIYGIHLNIYNLWKD